MTQAPVTQTDPIASANALAPEIRARADEIERNRAIPMDIVDKMRAAGLFHLVLPQGLGGLECDPVTASRVVEEVADADGSAGWVLMIAAQNQAFAGFLDDAAIGEIWGNGQIVCGVARPIGRAVRVESPEPGYLVSGRWPFASGTSHADWFGGECLVFDGDVQRKTADGGDISMMMPMRRADVTVHDTWDTTGLRGTASHDFSCENVFVPERHAIDFGDAPKQAWPVYKAFPLVVVNHGSQGLGVARAAVRSAAEVARTKAGWGGVPLREVARIQAAIAEATVTRESAATYLYDSVAKLWQAVLDGAGESETDLLRARARLAAAHAVQSSVRAVDIVHGMAGTSALFRTNPLERQFRDIHTAAAHVMIGPMIYEAAGRVELGRPAEFPFF